MDDKEPGVDVGYVELTVESPSGKAFLVQIEGEEVWIPKSQIHDDSEVWRKGDTGNLYITQWLAEQKGFA